MRETVVRALWLPILELAKDAIGEYPVLIQDEVLSELDHFRSSRLSDAIHGCTQRLLTTTDMVDAVVPRGLEFAPCVIERGRLEKQ